MGLFSNNKKLCPICDNPTPRLFPTKVEDMPICKDCAEKIDLPEGALDRMSLVDFKEYLKVYDDNKALRDIFKATYSYFVGFLSGTFAIDGANGLFRLKNLDTAFVMKGSCLRSFRIWEDHELLYESTPNGLKCYSSKIPDRVYGMSFQIAQYIMIEEQREQLERMNEKENGTGSSVSVNSTYPRMELPIPFEHFYVEGTLDHPYWKSFRWEIDAPRFRTERPTIADYMSDYNKKVNELHTLALNISELICPGGQEIHEA